MNLNKEEVPCESCGKKWKVISSPKPGGVETSYLTHLPGCSYGEKIIRNADAHEKAEKDPL